MLPPYAFAARSKEFSSPFFDRTVKLVASFEIIGPDPGRNPSVFEIDLDDPGMRNKPPLSLDPDTDGADIRSFDRYLPQGAAQK